MSGEYVGEAHALAAEYPGDLAEEMTCHAIERAVGQLIVALVGTGQPALKPGENRSVDLRLVLQCERQQYDGLSPDTVRVSATFLESDPA